MALTVAYQMIGKGAKLESGDKTHVMKLTFGDGIETYATGVALDKNKLGLPNQVKSIKMFDQAAANGYMYKFDFVNLKIRIYKEADAAGQMVELGAGVTPAAAIVYVEAVGW